jgi:uncharacterized protein involved in exopolysaccharide biosynthesis
MRFLETLFRHKLVAILPVVVGLLVAVGYQASQPKSYTSTGSLYVDASVPGNSPLNSESPYVDPSTLQQSAIQELLTTRSFAVAVGERGPLAAYLASHPHAESTGLAAVPLLSDLFGGSKGSVDDQVADELPTMVTIATGGPQVVNITVTAPSPSVAAGTAQALIDEYGSQTTAAQTSTDQVAVQYYDQQLGQAEATLQMAQQQLSAYLAAHPTVPATGVGNATATELAQAVTLDTTSYQSVLSEYQSAELSLANVGSQTGFQVLDAPSASSAPVSSSKKLLETGLAGFVVGLLVSVLLITALTAIDRTSRRAEDIRRALGLEVAATIARYPPSTAGSLRGNQI